jgi:hypothetical protein
LRHGLRDAGLRHLSWSASNLYFRLIHTSIREGINILGSPGERLRDTLVFCRLAAPPPPPHSTFPHSKTQEDKQKELGNEVRRRGWPSDILEMEGYPSAPSLEQYRNLAYPSHPFPHNTFSSYSPPIFFFFFFSFVFNLLPPLLSPYFVPLRFTVH